MAVAGLGLLVFATVPDRAFAWLAPGHMATGAIAYDALERRDPAAVAAIVVIEAAHPDDTRFDRLLAACRVAPETGSCSS